MIRFLCPTCSAKVQAPEEKIGLVGRCPTCGGDFVVPQASAPQFATLASAPMPLAPASIHQFPPPLSPVHYHPAPFAPLLVASPPKSKHRYLLPIAIVGVLLVGGTIFVTQNMNKPTGRGVAKLPRPKTMGPPAPQRPVPTYKPTNPSNPAQPQQRSALPPGNAPRFNPNPPRSSVRTLERAANDPRVEYPNSFPRRLVPIKQFPTASQLNPPVQVDDTIYFAARAGELYALDVKSPEMIEQRKLDKQIRRLFLDGSQLKADIVRGPAVTVMEFNKTVGSADPEDVELNGKLATLDGEPVPEIWNRRSREFNQVVLYKDKYYQPGPRSVRILENGSVTNYPAPATVDGLFHWKIALLPSGPVGYDKNSVYELDEHLCPRRAMIRLGMMSMGRAGENECFLAGDGKTMCFVQQTDNQKRMMIWSLDGKRKIREYSVYLTRDAADDARPISSWEYRAPAGRVKAVADGYLFCGREMTWLPAGPGDIFQFKPNERSPVADRDVVSGRQIFNVTPAVIAGSKIVVGVGGGGIYVFDTSAFSSTSATSPTTSPSRGGL